VLAFLRHHLWSRELFGVESDASVAETIQHYSTPFTNHQMLNVVSSGGCHPWIDKV